MILNMTGAGGGSSIDITAYATVEERPESAEENALAVITGTGIGKVMVDVTAPSAPSAGDLWISRVDTSEIILTVGDEQQMTIPIGQTRQWSGTAWSNVYAYLWKSNEWVRFSSLEMMYTYTGDHEKIDDGDGNWRIKLLTSGVLTFDCLPNPALDVFLVGGGGGTQSAVSSYSSGAGGGYTGTYLGHTATENNGFEIVVGAGGVGHADGGESSAFGYTASGGKRPASNAYNANGGAGGSGGGATWGAKGGNGGSDGGNGGRPTSPKGTNVGGVGQGTTTKEFGEETGTLYSGGGAGTGDSSGGTPGAGGGGAIKGNGTVNTGGGAGASYTTALSGGSGIVIIRNHREAS